VITPLQFHPFLRPMPWGDDRLARLLGKPVPKGQRIGESWEISDHRLHESIVAEGSHKGRSLRSLMEEEGETILGQAASRYRRFPWLVKFLDANDWLSVQVHPNDEQAARLSSSEGGKTEAWFVLDADPSSRIFAGLKKGVNEKKLREALAAGTVTDCLHSFEPRAGDCMFLPAGTVHAIGAGILIAELQQNSDATFRLFDWNRRDAAGNSRPLHIEESMACIDWTRTEVEPQFVAEYAQLLGSTPPRDVVRLLVDCSHFRIEYHGRGSPFDAGGMGNMQVWQILAGSASLGSAQLEVGQTWLLPAALPRERCIPKPNLALLVSTLP